MSSLSSYFNNAGTGTIDLSSYFNNSSTGNNQSKPFQNQYYQDALKNPDNYTWGAWDESKPLTADNWQPKPRQAGDARDIKSANYQKPFSVSDSIKDSKSNGTVSASNNNWTLPTYNYDPNLTWGFLNAIQSGSYNPQGQQSLRDNNNLKNEAAWQDLGVQYAAKAQGNQLANSQNWQNAQIDKWAKQPTSFSYTTVADPNSKEVQAYNTWQYNQTQNQIRAQAPALETQKQVQQIASTGTIDAARATAEAQKAAAQYQSDVSKAIAQIGKDQALATAQIAAQSQMYGANMGAMSSMFGSQMGAVGSMFGGLSGGGGGGRYW